MQTKRKYYLLSILGLFGFISLTGLGCRSCDPSTPIASKKIEITNCETYNNSESNCMKATQVDGKKCVYNKALKSCVAEAKDAPVCVKMTKEECLSNAHCKFNIDQNVCEPVNSMKNACEEIKMENTCAASSECYWDNVMGSCKLK